MISTEHPAEVMNNYWWINFVDLVAAALAGGVVSVPSLDSVSIWNFFITRTEPIVPVVESFEWVRIMTAWHLKSRHPAISN